jgi:hypothetical protein
MEVIEYLKTLKIPEAFKTFEKAPKVVEGLIKELALEKVKTQIQSLSAEKWVKAEKSLGTPAFVAPLLDVDSEKLEKLLKEQLRTGEANPVVIEEAIYHAGVLNPKNVKAVAQYALDPNFSPGGDSASAKDKIASLINLARLLDATGIEFPDFTAREICQ